MLVAKALGKVPIRLLCQPDWRGREYDIDQDSLWQHEVKSQPIDTIAWDQCDHPGTPMELTDHHGEVAWAGQYKAWGDVSEVRSDWAKQVGMTNPIRFQGQYHDHETGLHYNRYRYYDPRVGRFVSQDPISYFGGLSLYAYTLNPLHWVDALGLAPTPLNQPGYTVYGLYEPKATKPYYVGHTMQAESVREAQHANTGRLGEAKLVPIAKDLTYTQAKGRSNIIEKCMILRLVSLVM